MPKVLQISKSKKRRKLLKGKPVRPNAAILARYKKKIKSMTREMIKDCNARVINFFRKGYVDDFLEETKDVVQVKFTFDEKSPASSARLMMASIGAKYSKVFTVKSTSYAEWMAKKVNEDSATRVLGSIQEMTGKYDLDKIKNTKMIQEYMKNAINQSVGLIRNIETEYVSKLEGIVYRSLTGGGDQDIEEKLSKLGGMTERRAAGIAKDQITKAYSNLNIARYVAVGIKKYEWIHSQGSQHPRRLHIDVLDGNVFSIDNPPVIDERTGERGIPGQLSFCGCTAAPVFDLEEGEEEE
jgi:uncharacterized protein with gpF-like domain